MASTDSTVVLERTDHPAYAMSAELARLTAAQAKADEIVAAVAETPDGPLLLRVSVTDANTGQQLATAFANYTVDEPAAAPLRLVEATS